MPNYHRPESVTQALSLLSKAGAAPIVVAGGTWINAHMPANATDIIDLQTAGLDTVSRDGAHLNLGAMTHLQTIIDSADAPALLRDAARREGPNTFRHAATIGGVITGADWQSELLAALLVFDAEVTIATTSGNKIAALPFFLSDPAAALDGGLLTGVSLTIDGETAAERVARTPADQPIVAVVGRKTAAGQIRLAMCGVAKSPVLVDPTAIESLAPPDDFRGSSQYRREMAATLSQRVLNQL